MYIDTWDRLIHYGYYLFIVIGIILIGGVCYRMYLDVTATKVDTVEAVVTNKEINERCYYTKCRTITVPNYKTDYNIECTCTEYGDFTVQSERTYNNVDIDDSILVNVYKDKIGQLYFRVGSED